MTAVWMMVLRLSTLSSEINCEAPVDSILGSATASTEREAVNQAEKILSQQLNETLARSDLNEYSRWLNHLQDTQPETCVQPTSAGLTAHVWLNEPVVLDKPSTSSALSLRDVAGILSPLQ